MYRLIPWLPFLQIILILLQPRAVLAQDDCRSLENDYRQYQLQLNSDDRLADLKRLEGKIIRNVGNLRIDVFDPQVKNEDIGLYRFLNDLHARTRLGVINSQLLFKPGETFHVSEITESERLLRSRSYLIDAFIMPERECDDFVDLVVVTRDAWTLEPETSLSQEGGQTKSGFGLKEGNFLGTGSDFSIGYENTQNRERVFYRFTNPHFLQSRVSLDLGYADTTDGQDSLFRLELPFYSLKTPWALGGSTETVNNEEKIRQGDLLLDEYEHQSRNTELYYGHAINITPNYSSRMYVGVARERDNYLATPSSTSDAPANQDLTYPWLGYEFIENKYRVYRNINQIQRTEDIALGAHLLAKVGYGTSDVDDVQDEVLRYKLDFSDVIGVGKNHLVTFSALFDGREYRKLEGLNSRFFNSTLDYNGFLDSNDRWYARLSYSREQNLAPHLQITAGGSSSLRGYPLDYLRGTDLTELSLERRHFSNKHIFNLFRIGYVAFFDAGRMRGGDNRWVASEDPDDGHDFITKAGPRNLYDIGFGLRLTSSKTNIGNVVHIDFAIPLTDRDVVSDYQILIKAQKTF